mmetsp:Transcript_9747/g.16961  ORF Transcript_9747/g.16961 Transcript_9747/m.16961 type:complete len:318 (+) Transcript_9747:473-1426(+)
MGGAVCLGREALDALGTVDRVAEQHRDGHWAYATGHRRDLARHLGNFRVVNVADETVALGARRVVLGVDADVNHHRAGLHPALLHQLRLADGGDDDVRLRDDVGQIRRLRMADRDGGVALHEQHRGREAHDVAPPQHHGFLTADLHAGALEEIDAALWGASDGGGLRPAAHAKAANVYGMEAVNVLLEADGSQDDLFVDVGGERELHQDAVNVRIRVEVRHDLEDFFLACIFGKVNPERNDSDLFAALLLRTDIGGGVLPFANENHGETRPFKPSFDQIIDLLLQLFFDYLRDLLPVNNTCRGSGLARNGRLRLVHT